MLTTIVIIAGLTQLLVSLIVFSRGRKNLSYFFFFLVGITSLSWALTNYLSVALLESSNLQYIVRFVLFFVVLQNAAFYLFARTFPLPNWRHSRKGLAAYGVLTLIAAAATLSPFVFTSVSIDHGLPVTKTGPAILIFVVHAVVSIVVGLRALIKKMHRAVGVQKNQLQILLMASLLNWVAVPFTNFVLTLAVKTTVFTTLSPIYTLLFAGIIAYAIVAQKLFDIKLIVARSVAYLLALGFLITGYATFSNLIVNGLLADSSTSISLIVNSVIFLIAVLLYPSFKSFFDHATKKLFYRDAYDTQAFLDQLNRILVVNVELENLLRQTAQVIEDNLKADFCLFWIPETSYLPERTIGISHKRLEKTDVELIREITPQVHKRVIEADILSDKDSKLRNALLRNDIAVLAQVDITMKHEIKGIAYMVLGQKKSGNPYNNQDIKMCEIISNELVIAVQNAMRFEEIQHFNVTLQGEIESATRQLRKTNQRLRVLDETKDDFISMASHQLRTPLTSVKGYLSMVLEGDAGKISEKQGKLLDQAFISSQRMVYLIADLLNVSRLRTGKFVLEVTPTNLADVVHEEVGQLVETAAARELKLSYDKPKDFPVLYIDETKIRQVIMNFIDNAIYYTPSGGHIQVVLEQTQQSITLTVNDDGIGVPKPEQHHLFSKFYRAGNAKKARPDGTGLGLFMAKKVVIAQGGGIIFRSHEGKGSTFGFTFAKAKLQPPHVPASDPGVS